MPGSALSALFQLPPELAIRYLEAKGFKITWDWWEMQRAAHARAFTVAKVTRLDILRDIREALEQALREGQTERWFRQQLEETLRSKGWWGRQLDETGRAYQAGSPRRLQTIYRTNLQNSYMAGRQKQFDAEIERAPFVQYLAVMDSKTRPDHAELHGQVFRLDDPAWDTICPPNGFGCRCRARNFSQRELDARGLTVQTDTRIEERRPPNAKPGLERQSGVSVPDGNGGRKTLWPDLGWDFNPGRSAPWGDIDLWGRVRQTLPPDLAARALLGHALHPTRLAAFDDWVDSVLRQSGAMVGAGWVIGYLARADAETLGNIDSGALVLDGARLVGPGAQRPDLGGAALSSDDWKRLPRLLAEPEAVLFDRERGTLLYVLPGPGGKKIVVESGDSGGADRPASVRSAFAVDAEQLRRFQVLRGSLP